MRVRALTLAALCVAVSTAGWAAPPDGGGPHGKGPDGQGPPGHAGDPPPPAPPPPPDPPAAPGQTPLSPEGQVTIGADQNVARDAVDAGRALPLADISARITAALGVRVIDARLISTRGMLVYRLVVLTDAGVSSRIYVDARTGNQIPAR